MSQGEFAWPRLAIEVNATERAALLVEAARREGHEAGYQAGLAEARNDNEQLQQALRDSSERLDDYLNGSQAALASDFLSLAQDVLRALLDAELALQPTVLEGVVQRALRALDDAHPKPVVRVAETALAWLSESWREAAEVIVDNSLDPGVVRIEGGDTQFEFDPFGEIQALVETASDVASQSDADTDAGT